MNKHTALLALFAGCVATFSTGCEWVLLGVAVSDDDTECLDCSCDNTCVPTTPDPADPPTVDILIADWPPIGPDGIVTVEASSDDGLSGAFFSFRNAINQPMSGLKDSATANGSDLGEGLGSLSVTVTSSQLAQTRRQVDGLLVDLTPPTVYVDKTTLPAEGGVFEYWMADAWVVSGSELDVDGTVRTTQLDAGYPDTLGTDWDFSLVAIPTSELPPGSFNATIRVWDAAGNEATFDVPLTIDGVPPVAEILSPAEGETVSGVFQVSAAASDDLAATTEVEFWAGGALVATGTGPSAFVTLDASEFPLGPLEITVYAVDRAGNRSAAASHQIVIGP